LRDVVRQFLLQQRLKDLEEAVKEDLAWVLRGD
jgi:hypothetical protein